ncbi:MAG: hypothetical protein M0P26_06525 [Bacteroidales bacterium]|nr:hypothetical protein [Bacteroidales bacterium]
MTNLITIQQAVENFKLLIEGSILEGGIKSKEAMIRSSRPISQIHEAVKADLIRNCVPSILINPPLGETKPELKLAGFIKQKNQDICVSPLGYKPQEEIMTEGILREEIDYYGKAFTERTISINVRSQMSSLAKNFDTLYERTIAEAQNLHVRCPKMILGEVYMIPVKEYDASVMDDRIIRFVKNVGSVEKYIKSFQAINQRADYTREDYKYERVCLLLVDFEQNPVKIYNNNQDLIRDGLLRPNSDASVDGLTWENFSSTILELYNNRFAD